MFPPQVQHALDHAPRMHRATATRDGERFVVRWEQGHHEAAVRAILDQANSGTHPMGFDDAARSLLTQIAATVPPMPPVARWTIFDKVGGLVGELLRKWGIVGDAPRGM